MPRLRDPEHWDPPLLVWVWALVLFVLCALNIAVQYHHQNDGGDPPAVEEIQQHD